MTDRPSVSQSGAGSGAGGGRAGGGNHQCRTKELNISLSGARLPSAAEAFNACIIHGLFSTVMGRGM